MRVVLSVGIAALVAGLVFARDAMAQPAGSSSPQSSIGIPLSSKHVPTQEEIEKQRAEDRAYEKTLQKMPDKKAPSDPWGAMRPAPAAKTTDKPAAKTKAADKSKPQQPPSQ
jgi:hypothetical protein